MAITAINITQDNKSGNVDLLSIHNPLVFLVDVDYTAEVPDTLYVDLLDELGVLIATFAAIPYSDSASGSTRTFAFLASDILRSYMTSFDDFESPENTLEFVPNITRQFSLKFYIGAVEDSVSFVACHAARQYGESPAMEDIYNNINETYYTGAGRPVYVYFYNNNPANILTIDSPTADEYALTDSDDTVFIDQDDSYFKSL
jgi:hypothetical protein